MEEFTRRYNALNPAQKEAVDTIEGPLMVIAGPGTGKTELLSMRAANILKQTDTLPENILCLTFTESGANAMRERLTSIIGADAYKLAIHTFHSFGSEIINQYGQYFYSGADFRPADELSTYELLRSIFDELEHSNPLASTMNGEYTYLPDVVTAISELKRSGLTSDELLAILDANDEVLDAVERDLGAVFSVRVNKTTALELESIARKLAELPIPQLPPGIAPLGNVLALSLANALDTANVDGSTKPITAWKNKWCEKNEAGTMVLKDRARAEKLRALSYIYYQYLVKMQENRRYDFDDMVLRVVHAMEVFPELRFNLQEKYLYIMVDEFQDTNLAQLRILHDLTSSEINDAPNLMVVGDDDQAIYAFQGAELSNLTDFTHRFETLKKVVLQDNYRSSEAILDAARQVITQADNRLEAVLDIDKSLTPNYQASEAAVTLHEYARCDDERIEVVAAIKQMIAKGTDPCDIAILTRRHYELMNLLPHFAHENISVNYERRDNILENEIIHQLELLGGLVRSIAIGDLEKANAWLPQLLAHPAWSISTQHIWELSLAASKNHTSWLEEMPPHPAFATLHSWLLELARLSLTEPVEPMIDHLTGTPDSSSEGFSSPLYGYFFGDSMRQETPDAYLVHLEALRTIRAKLREHQPELTLTLSDFLDFIELHQRIGDGITSIRIRSDAPTGAVNLMTAHKAKGLEFKHVFIIGAVDSAWGERVRSRSRLIKFPENLPLSPAGDTISERLRLFFVAMTRARDTLHISYSLMDDNDKATSCASFLLDSTWKATQHTATTDIRTLESQLQQEWYQPLVSLPQTDMKNLLSAQLERYKLSATHLNNFLDVTRGGPQYFLINNLLRFPQSMSPNAAYGSAIHRTLQRAHAHLTSTKIRKPLEDILTDFEQNLRDMHLSGTEFQHYFQRGTDALHAFLDQTYDTFTPDQIAELSFSYQQSIVNDAHLTGALDLVSIDKDTKAIHVTDYKTGKAASSWKGNNDYEKIKLHKYRQQLLFYKLLVEHSRDYHGYTVTDGTLQFVEPTSGGNIISLTASFNDQEVSKFTELLEVVYQKITSLDLPDTSRYDSSLAGIKQFEQDLLDKNI